MYTSTRLVLIVCFLLVASGVRALPVVMFDFTGSGAVGPAGNEFGLGVGVLGTNTLSLSKRGVNVAITAADTGAPGTSDTLTRTAPGGLGIEDAAGAAAIGPDEAIAFDFSPAAVFRVSALTLEISPPGRAILNGSFSLFVDDVFSQNVGWGSGDFSLFTHSFGDDVRGSKFEFRGRQLSFRVAALTVEVVPEPPEFVLFVTALAACLGFIHRDGLPARPGRLKEKRSEEVRAQGAREPRTGVYGYK